MAEVHGTAVLDTPERSKSDHEDAPEPQVKAKKSKLPTPRTFTLIPSDFYAYVAALTDRDWGHVALYVYRLANPRIVRDPSNVDSIDREPPSIPFTEQYLKDTQGSGKFEVKLNDTDSRTTVCRMLTDINDPDYPPKFDIRELDVGYKGNRLIVERLKREGKLSLDGDVVQKTETSDAGMATALKEIAIEAMRGRKDQQPGIENQATIKMMDMMAKASEKSIEIALGQVKKEDPASFIALLTTAKELFTPAAKPEGESQTFTLLMRMLDASEKRAAQALEDAKEDRQRAEEDRKRQHDIELAERKHQHELELERLKQKADAASPIAMVKEVLELQRQVGELGGGEKRNWKEKLVDEGLEHLPRIFDLADKALGYRRAQAGAPQGAHQQPPPPTAVSQPIQSVNPQTQPPSPTGESVPQQAPLDPEIAFLLPIFEKFGQRLVAAFADDPNSGAEVAAAVSSKLLAGRADYERICRMGREKILATIELIPQMKEDCLRAGTAAMLNDFIVDFIEGPDDDPDEDEPDDNTPDDPPEPVELPAPRKKKDRVIS